MCAYLRKQTPERTSFMRLRDREALDEGKSPHFSQHWVGYSRISPTLVRAVLVTEDAAFWISMKGLISTEPRVDGSRHLGRKVSSFAAAPRSRSSSRRTSTSRHRGIHIANSTSSFITRRLEAGAERRPVLIELYLTYRMGRRDLGRGSGGPSIFWRPGQRVDAGAVGASCRRDHQSTGVPAPRIRTRDLQKPSADHSRRGWVSRRRPWRRALHRHSTYRSAVCRQSWADRDQNSRLAPTNRERQ